MTLSGLETSVLKPYANILEMSSQWSADCLDPRTQLMGKYYVGRIRFHPDPTLADSNQAFDSVIAIINRGNSMMNFMDMKTVVLKFNRLGLRTPLVLGKTMSEDSTCTFQDCLNKLEDLVQGNTTFTFPAFSSSIDLPPFVFRNRPLSFVDFCLLANHIGRLPDQDGLAVVHSFAPSSHPASLPDSIPGAYYVPPGSRFLPNDVAPSSPPVSSAPPLTF